MNTSVQCLTETSSIPRPSRHFASQVENKITSSKAFVPLKSNRHPLFPSP